MYRSARIQEMLIEKSRFEKIPMEMEAHRKQAEMDYQTLQKVFPGSEWVDNASFRLLKMRNPDVSAYIAFTQQNPDSDVMPEALMSIGEHYLGNAEHQPEQGQKAATYFQRLINSYPQSELRSDALLKLSRSYYLAGNLDLATPTLKQLMQGGQADKSQQAQAWLLMGQILFTQKKYGEAKKNFKEVLFKFQGTASAPKAQYLLAQSYDAERQFAHASNAYRRYVDQYTDGEDVLAA
jgi:TolA-binding protein